MTLFIFSFEGVVVKKLIGLENQSNSNIIFVCSIIPCSLEGDDDNDDDDKDGQQVKSTSVIFAES